MHDTYAGHRNAVDFVAEDGHEFVEIWQQVVGILAIQSQSLRADGESRLLRQSIKLDDWIMMRSVLG
jgi:hypothetical protein